MSDRNELPRIMCLDDERAVLQGLEVRLRRGYRVSTYDNGEDALAALQAERDFMVVVSDMRMPGMDGVTFLERARLACPDVVRILLTGQADIESAVGAVNRGEIFRFLLKPAGSGVLEKAIGDALELRRLVTQDRELMARKLDELAGDLLRAERLATVRTVAGAVGQEVQSIGHLLTSAIAGLRGSAVASEPPGHDDLGALEVVLKHLVKHASNLQALARPRAALVERVQLDGAVARLVQMVQTTGFTKRVYLDTHLAEEPLHVLIDRGKLEQVLLNLVRNAVDATEGIRGRSPRVAIRLEKGERGRAHCSVTDNGHGIDPASIDEVVDAYVTTKPAGRGSGLGLASVKHIVEEAGGELTLTSRLGEGTVATIALPLAHDGATGGLRSVLRRAFGSGEKRTA